MTVRTVRLDKDTEKILEQLQAGTGKSISTLLKQGLLALRDQMSPPIQRSAFEIYEALDLGEGGYATVPSTDAKRGVQEAIRRKLNR